MLGFNYQGSHGVDIPQICRHCSGSAGIAAARLPAGGYSQALNFSADPRNKNHKHYAWI